MEMQDQNLFKTYFTGGSPCKNIIFHLFMMCDLDGKILLKVKIRDKFTDKNQNHTDMLYYFLQLHKLMVVHICMC